MQMNAKMDVATSPPPGNTNNNTIYQQYNMEQTMHKKSKIKPSNKSV